MPETRHTFCRICEVLCGLEVTVDGARVTDIRPDAHHVATAGYACIKGLKQHQIYDSSDRLLWPEKRVGSTWKRIPWDEAFAEIGATLRRILGERSPDAVAMYVGTAAGFGVLHPAFAQGFMQGIGSRSMYASATQDCSNKFGVARELYGFPFTQPFPDLDRTGCLIVVGANPAVSKWSFLQVPNPVAKLRALEDRGARLWFVDPRRTESARAAGEHVFIRPGTDVFFYLSFLAELCALGAIDRDRLARHTTGFDEVEALCRPFPAERTAAVTRIPPDLLRRMARDYATGSAGSGAALYSSTGVNMGGRGALGFWLQEVINCATGNLDRLGGTLVGRGVIDFAAFGRKTGVLLRNDRSRVGDFPSVNDAFPGGVLADEILTPGDRQVRALFVTGGNPLITMPNSGRLRRAFQDLELLVTLDLFKNETGSLAHYILPSTTPLERPDLPFIFPLMLGLQSKPYLQATLPVVPPKGGVRDEASIYVSLCRAAGVPIFGSRIAQSLMQGAMAAHSALHPDDQPSIPQRLLLDLLLRATGQGGFGPLLRETHGRARHGHVADDFLGKRVVTDDGKVHLATPPLLERARTLESDFNGELKNAHRLKLITRRAVTTHNSWTHNLPAFVHGDRGTNYLYMHPDDANAAGLAEGDFADVTTEVATVRVPVAFHSDLMPGTVALPHGWGHQHATGLSVASRTRGVNVNLLAGDGPGSIEPVSNMSHLTGFLVDVKPAAGPADTTDWSGIAPSATRPDPLS